MSLFPNTTIVARTIFLDRVAIAKVSCGETFFVLAMADNADRSRSLSDFGYICPQEARLRQSIFARLEDYKKNLN